MVTGLLTALLGLSGPVAATPTLATLAPQALAIALAPHEAGRPATTSQRNRRSRQPSEGEPEGDVDEEKSPPDSQQGPDAKPKEPESKDDEPREQNVSGRVEDRNHKGLSDSKVTVAGPRSDTVWTDSNGSFHFTGPPGKYVLTIKSGEVTKRFSTTIVNDQLDLGVFTIEK